MNNSQDQVKCEDCRYFEGRSKTSQGVCHIRSPQVVTAIDSKGIGSPQTTWPAVKRNNWCGEFAQKTEPIVEMKNPEAICQSPK
jgi:hypothetical protein